MRGQRPHELAQLDALAHGICDPVEHFRSIASGLALQAGDNRDLLELPACHPPRDAVERHVERHPQLLVGDRPAHLTAGRLGRLARHHRKRADDGVAGAHCGCDHLQRLRKLIAEVSPLLGQLALDGVEDEQGDEEAEDAEDTGAEHSGQ